MPWGEWRNQRMDWGITKGLFHGSLWYLHWRKRCFIDQSKPISNVLACPLHFNKILAAPRGSIFKLNALSVHVVHFRYTSKTKLIDDLLVNLFIRSRCRSTWMLKRIELVIKAAWIGYLLLLLLLLMVFSVFFDNP